MKTVFLLSHVPNPRINKRIAVLKNLGDVALICVRRKIANIWEPYHLDIKNVIFDMDMPPSSRLIERLRYSNQFRRLVNKKLCMFVPSVIYAEGLDSLVIACQYKKKHLSTKIILEVADLREIFMSNKISVRTEIIKKVEKYFVKQADLLVITSELFYERHYKAFVDREKVLYMPNVPDAQVFTYYRKKSGGKFTIGFIGGIRYLRQMKILVDAAESCDFDVLFAGAGGSDDEYREIFDYCADKQFVRFTGKYKYNEEIAGLYGQVNCVYAVYDADNPNVRIALPNKLYEAVYCGLPIIVAKGTYLAELVEKWGVGIAVSHNSTEDLRQALERLADKDDTLYDSIVQACRCKKPEINIDKYNKLLEEKLKGFYSDE